MKTKEVCVWEKMKHGMLCCVVFGGSELEQVLGGGGWYIAYEKGDKGRVGLPPTLQ